MPYVQHLDRKSIWNGLLVVRGQGMNAGKSVYKVVDAGACDTWGNPMKGGRYCAIRRWDVEKDEFFDDATRTGEKPGDLCTFEAWSMAWAGEWAKYREEDAKVRSEYEAVWEFMESVGLHQSLSKQEVTGPDGTRYLRSYSLHLYDTSAKTLLRELGVIPEPEEA